MTPLCGGSDAEVFSTPAVRTHGEAVAASNPPFTISCWAPPPPEAAIVRLIEVVWLRVPDVPVIVIDDVPVVAVALAVKVKTLLPVVGFVPKLAVTPEGRADVESDTLPVNPPLGVTVIVELPLVPCVTLKLLGEAESVKFGVVPPAAGNVTQLFAALENSN